jgi:hypothetical protein
VEADYVAAHAEIPNGAAKAAGILIGQASAATILAVRAADGSDTPLLDFAFPQGTEPGEWRFNPILPFAFAPGWGDVTPFVLRHASQFRPSPRYEVGSHKYTADFNEVKAVGGDGVTTPGTRTAEQTEIGRFWLRACRLHGTGWRAAAESRLDPRERAIVRRSTWRSPTPPSEGQSTPLSGPETAMLTADTDGNLTPRRTSRDPLHPPT